MHLCITRCLLKVYFHCGTQTICWLDWTKGAFRNLGTLLVCFISILKPTQPVYAFDTPGAASEGDQCTTAGCVQRNVTKHRALNWGWNNFFWAGGGEGGQAEQKKRNRKLHKSCPRFYPIKSSCWISLTADKVLIENGIISIMSSAFWRLPLFEYLAKSLKSHCWTIHSQFVLFGLLFFQASSRL